jgi:thymidylate synthase (FAD)
MIKFYDDILKVRLVSYSQPADVIGIEDVQDLIAFCAKVSNPKFQDDFSSSDKLLAYLIKHKHWSPFEMANATLEITTTRDIARQALRHRSFAFQEFCIAGDSEIYFDMPSALKKGKKALYKKSIADLYKTWNSSSFNKQRIQNMQVRVYDEDKKIITHANIKDIFFTGKKPLFKITLENGKSITSTKEHKFLAENGFDTLENLVGLQLNNQTASMSKHCSIATNGIPVHRDKEWLSLAKQRAIENKSGLSGIAEEAGVTYHTIRKWLKIHGLSFTKKEVASYTEIWNKGKFGYKLPPKSEEVREKHRKSARKGADSNLWKGGVDRAFRLQVTDYIAKYRKQFLEQANYQCVQCSSNEKLELHHKIPVYQDESKAFDLDNIEVLCKKCHRSIHAIDKSMPKGKGNLLTKRFSKVVSVEYVGEQDTYDLEIDHASHNYVANGIITHNSQRYKEVDALDTSFAIREARLQHPKDRQSSIELDESNAEHVELNKSWVAKQQQLIHEANLAYKWALDHGIAKECARSVLPEGNTVSRVYMNGTIRSWIHYIELRAGNGTQKEHMLLAKECAKAINKIFPYINL